jgi:SAM-dependent methyltransferase
VSRAPRFLTWRRSDVHSTKPWSQFAYVNEQLTDMVRDLTGAAALPVGTRLLDYGCADRPYRDVFPPSIEYVGADIPGNALADVDIAPDGTIPLPDESFDLVLSTQVLEHVEDPAAYLSECFRLLRPGGALVLSTHGIMYYHRDPEDYWRWTPAGLRRIVIERGFEVERLRGLLGLASAALQLFQDGTYWFVPRLMRRPYALVMQRLIAFSDHRYSEAIRAENSWTIAVRALRPAPAVAASEVAAATA